MKCITAIDAEDGKQCRIGYKHNSCLIRFYVVKFTHMTEMEFKPNTPVHCTCTFLIHLADFSLHQMRHSESVYYLPHNFSTRLFVVLSYTLFVSM